MNTTSKRDMMAGDILRFSHTVFAAWECVCERDRELEREREREREREIRRESA